MRRFLIIFVTLFWVTGCKEGHSREGETEVSGIVIQHTGVPMPGGLITFFPEGSTVSAAAALVQEDGSYTVRLPPGIFKIALSNDAQKKVARMPKKEAAEMNERLKDSKNPVSIRRYQLLSSGKWVPLHAKYLKSETSGLTCEVQAGTHPSFDVRLDRP